MDFALSGEQTLIKDSVDRFVADSYAQTARERLADSAEGFSREHWATFASLGWLGVAFSEEHGGFGGTPIETMIVLEGFGRGLVLEPFVPTVVLGGTALAAGGTSQEHRDLLGSVIEGDTLLSFAYAEPRSGFDYAHVETIAQRHGNDYVVTGTKVAVPFAASADHLVVTARTAGTARDEDGLVVLLVEKNAKGVVRRDYRTVDGARASDVSFDGVHVPASAVLGEPGKALPLIERVIDAGLGALCAESVGVMSVMLDATVDYLKTREQFGRPIGSFQALQHRAVDMFIALELARSMELYGTLALVEDFSRAERGRALSAAKVQAARSGRIVGEGAIQLHGGIGMSEEYRVGHYFKRMTVLGFALGDVAFHTRRYRAARTSSPTELARETSTAPA